MRATDASPQLLQPQSRKRDSLVRQLLLQLHGMLLVRWLLGRPLESPALQSYTERVRGALYAAGGKGQ